MKKLTTEAFIIKAHNIHKKKYDYSLVIYKFAKTKIKIICPIHGQFEQMCHSHLSGRGCPKCGFENAHLKNVKTKDNFISKAKIIHDDKYDYSLVNIIDNKTKIKIICSEHGEFYQTPHAHKRGNGCPKCGNIKISQSAINTSRGWTLTDWKNKIISTNSIPRLYIIRCFNDIEEFIKVGITMRTITERFRNKTLMPYEYEILSEISLSSDDIFNTEILIKRIFKENKYKPKIKFSGFTECFSIKIKEEILKFNNEKSYCK